MSTSRLARVVVLALASGTLVLTAAFWTGASPAGAASTTPATTCGILGLLCPPTTPAKAPVTTAPPTTVRQTTSTTTAKKPVTTATTATQSRQPTGVASVGVAGLPLAGVGNIPALGADPASAPQLAGTASATTTTVAAAPPTILTPRVVSGLVGATGGLPNDHATLRIVLSVLALLIAGVAAAQLPASRRSPGARNR